MPLTRDEDIADLLAGTRPRKGMLITFAAASAPPDPNGSEISPQCGQA